MNEKMELDIEVESLRSENASLLSSLTNRYSKANENL